MKNNQAEYLYLHVPFCKHICSYCDFNRGLYNPRLADLWTNKIIEELKQQVINQNLKTIYIGGGTPTSLSLEQLDKLLTTLDDYTNKIEEYTIESNLDLTNEKINCLVEHGINRISLGVQSYNDDLLKVMLRKHTSKDIDKTINQLVDQGITNISIDLIYGFKEQSLDMWMDALKQACDNPYIKHISIYSLTIEENSILGKNNYEMVDNELEAKMYEEAIKYLTTHGFYQYEIANFAKPNYESKHNQAYWHYEDFYGIGVGASSKLNHTRIDTSGSVNDYLNNDYHKDIYSLTNNDEIEEFIMMNLRLRKGLNLNRFNELFNINFNEKFKEVNNELLNKKAIEIKNGYLKVTYPAMFYLHDIIIKYMEAL